MNAGEFNLYGWVLEAGRVDYGRALAWQHKLLKMRREGMARDTIILLEHPPVITIGKDGHEKNFRGSKLKPIKVERGGDVTYHGPGQLVVYLIFNLTRRGKDLHHFMSNVQQGIIDTFAEYGLAARKDEQYTGVWIEDRKIASIGVAVRHWITFHGAAINLNTNLSDFEQINPCGLNSNVMTTAADLLGKRVDRKRFGRILLDKYGEIFRTTFTPLSLEDLDEELESQAGGYTV